MSSPNPSLPRRPGGQPGNTNAVKHGFYSPRIGQSGAGNPQKVTYTGVSDEIAMLRKSIRRVVDMSKDIQNLPDALSYLRVLALASMSLSRLVRAQKLITDSYDRMAIGRPVSEDGAALGDAGLIEESDEFDPTVEWAKFDPPEELLSQYLDKFEPSRYGGKDEEDEED